MLCCSAQMVAQPSHHVSSAVVSLQRCSTTLPCGSLVPVVAHRLASPVFICGILSPRHVHVDRNTAFWSYGFLLFAALKNMPLIVWLPWKMPSPGEPGISACTVLVLAASCTDRSPARIQPRSQRQKPKSTRRLCLYLCLRVAGRFLSKRQRPTRHMLQLSCNRNGVAHRIASLSLSLGSPCLSFCWCWQDESGDDQQQ